MDCNHLCQPHSRKRLTALADFLADQPDLFSRLPAASHAAYINICGYIAHLRGRQSRQFFLQMASVFESLADEGDLALILAGARRLAAANWALVLPYFATQEALADHSELREQWVALALYLARLDVDAAIAFLTETPRAMAAFGAKHLLTWGGLALEALQWQPTMAKTACGFLETSVDDQLASDWARRRFFLRQAARIAVRSPDAALAFISQGSRACLLLRNEETEQWVSVGLNSSQTEGELVNFFDGTSLRALESRDRLASGACLKDHINALTLIGRASLAWPIRLRANTSLLGLKDFHGSAATDGCTIFLPPTAPHFELLKLMTLHQAAIVKLTKSNGFAAGISAGGAFRAHLAADRLLLSRLPELRVAMENWADDGIGPDYPSPNSLGPNFAPLWWGDYLPELVTETEATLEQLVKMAAEEHPGLPPATVESLAVSMMAEGERSLPELRERLKKMFDSMERESSAAEKLEDNFKSFYYREWDSHFRDYKLGWCLVRQRTAKSAPNPFVEQVREQMSGLINLIRRQFMMLKPDRFKKLRAQVFGDDLDMEALVQAMVEKKSGSFLSDAVYIRRDKRVRDVAVLFLLDMSGSTGARVNGRRVIDIQKQAMVLMAEALDSLGDPYAILGFSSDGRFGVDLFRVKDFQDPYDEKARHRLGGLEPLDFTRLGAVVRHGIYKLSKIQAAIKLMVILTDGRPYDDEYGDLDYALADTRKSFQEAKRHHINPFIITSDKRGSDYLKMISPTLQSIVVANVEMLPTLLPDIYKRLTG